LWRRGLYNTHTSNDVYIFLPINIDQLAAAFDSFLQSPNACTAFFIVDGDGALVTSRGHVEAVPEIDWDSLALETEQSVVQADGSVLLQGKSAIQGWRFVFVYSPEVFWWQTRMMGAISAVLITFYVLVALSIGIWYYRWNKRQVVQILKTLEDKAGLRARTSAGEYQSIQGALLELVHQQNSLRAQAHSQTVRLRKAYLQNLITGRIQQQGFRLEHSNEALGLALSDTHFAVLLAVCPVGQSALYADSATLEENEQILHFAVENIAEEMLAPLGHVYALEYGESIVLLVNLYARDLAPLRSAALEMLQTFRQLLQAPVTVVLSGLQDGVRNIQYAYQEAMEAMEHANSNGQSFCAYTELP
ncbi:MAG TPA: hypothetical protein PKE04_23480, partial [Clostridia bacterium]|nr:hypothetical protein [Clostridia bacterium]